MYCKRCDKDNVGSFHRCFWYGFKLVRPLKKRPHPNTPLAKKLATYYEECYEKPFPGGIQNARVKRDDLAIRAYKDAGAWVWSLWTIDHSFGNCREFGSEYRATECAKNKLLIKCGYNELAF